MIHGNMTHYPSGRKKKYNAWKKTKRKPVEFKPMQPQQTYRRETPHYPSLEPDMTTGGVGNKKESPKYTGTLVKGISTMHKSNAVPIINKQEAKDHANMRR